MSGNKKFQPNMKLIALCNWKNIVTITILVERTLSHPSNAKIYQILLFFTTYFFVSTPQACFWVAHLKILIWLGAIKTIFLNFKHCEIF